jgi:hypothetical protein
MPRTGESNGLCDAASVSEVTSVRQAQTDEKDMRSRWPRDDVGRGVVEDEFEAVAVEMG